MGWFTNHLSRFGAIGTLVTSLCCLGFSALVSLLSAIGLGFLINDARMSARASGPHVGDRPLIWGSILASWRVVSARNQRKIRRFHRSEPTGTSPAVELDVADFSDFADQRKVTVRPPDLESLVEQNVRKFRDTPGMLAWKPRI